MTVSGRAELKHCAVCGADVSRRNAEQSVRGADGKKYLVCSDACSQKKYEALFPRHKSIREDQLLKSFGLPTVREQQIERNTDRLLRDLGIA